MTSNEVMLTPEGLKKLEEELEYLRSVKRREIAEKIKHSLAFGDISENAEYDMAKTEQAQVEGRIIQLENMLKNAKLIDEDEIDTKTVSLGSKVEVMDLESEEKIQYFIVGSAEADPSKGRISNQSPVGKALIGKKKGNVIEVQVPGGYTRLKIVSIKK